MLFLRKEHRKNVELVCYATAVHFQLVDSAADDEVKRAIKRDLITRTEATYSEVGVNNAEEYLQLFTEVQSPFNHEAILKVGGFVADKTEELHESRATEVKDLDDLKERQAKRVKDLAEQRDRVFEDCVKSYVKSFRAEARNRYAGFFEHPKIPRPKGEPKFTDMMIDIETLDTVPGAVIASIGAVMFDPLTGDIGDKRHFKLHIGEAFSKGYTISESTLAFWRKQSDKSALLGSGSIEYTLHLFRDWILQMKPRRVWANSPSFDLDILREAFKREGVKFPIHYRQECDVRTIAQISKMMGKKITKVAKNKHDALADAKNQVKWVAEFFKDFEYVTNE